MPWELAKRKKWEEALPSLIEDAVAALREKHVTWKTIDHDEVKAVGVRAFDAAKLRDPTLHLQPLWNWGYKRWIAPVLVLFRQRTHEERAARVLAKCVGEPIPRIISGDKPKRFKDTLKRDHPGYEVFENVFTYSECDQMLRAQERVTNWENVFNSIYGSIAGGRATTKRGNKRARTDATDVSVSHSKRPSGVVLSAFRQQGKVDAMWIEELIKERLTPLLPENAVFAPKGSVAYMMRNVRTGIPQSASRAEQPVHYDFARGLQRLSVMIALEHHVYLALGDRWSKDWATIKMRVPITKGSVIIFSNTVPHAGMGDVGIEGCARLRLYIGLGCLHREVHPKSDDGGFFTYLACNEYRARV